MELDVWDEMAELERRMDDLMRSSLWPSARLAHPVLPLFLPKPFVPPMDVFARDGDLVIRLEVPGVDPGRDITVAVEEGFVVVRGERRREEESTKGRYYRMEASYGSFERRVPIRDGVDEEAIQASYVEGVLEVVVPGAASISEPQKVKNIPIKGKRKQ